MNERSASAVEQIVNLSWQRSDWNWLAHAFPQYRWLHRTCWGHPLPLWVPRHALWVRMHAAIQAASDCRGTPSVLVSHGPIPASYGATAAARLCPETPHLVYAFNFTELPTGLRHRWMRLAFKSVDKFTVFSSMERQLYARHFDLPIERFDMLPWSARPLAVDRQAPALVQGDYICAIGSQGRDYRVLLQAMARLPGIRLVLVAHPENLQGCEIPGNVSVRTRIPLADVSNILAHSRFMALPLRDNEVPCGHVTIVSALHEGKAVLATNSSGVHDYITHGQTGWLCDANDPAVWAEQIQALWEQPERTHALGQQGQAFAKQHCDEASAVRYFQQVLKGWA